MTSKIYILRGVSGSGKTTWTDNKRKEVYENFYEDFRVFSADKFFTNESGIYNFNPKQLGQAHAYCLRSYANTLQDQYNSGSLFTGVVDNTNTTVAEVAPYAALALAYSCELEILTFMGHLVGGTPIEEIHARNRHDVPLKTVKAQHRRLFDSVGKFPDYWKETVIKV